MVCNVVNRVERRPYWLYVLAIWTDDRRRVLWIYRFGVSVKWFGSILVDPASCHMLVSKIKPCMSKYTLWHSETANGSLNQLWFIRSCVPMWITVVILELIHATGPDFTEGRFY